MKTKYIFVVILISILMIPNSFAVTSDPALKISIGSEVFNGVARPTVTLENSIQKVVIRTQNGGIGTGGIESVIKDWTLKSANTDIVSKFVDANSFRGILSKAVITNNGENSKTVRLTYARGSIMEYTIDANSPIIKIKYEKYDVIPTSNIVDFINTGGVTRVYGQEGWIRPITSSYYPCAYWDSYETSLGGCGITYGPDTANAGSLNYKGHIIMAFGQTGSNGIGFGRVMPIYTGTNGGIRILKIFSTGGFEPYQATAHGQLTRPAHYGYIYLFKQGVDNAITQGKQIVDGKTSSTAITVISPNGGESWGRGTTKTITWSSSGNPGANVKIELLKSGAVNTIIASGISNDGSHPWAIPNTQTLGTDYKIRITSTSNPAYTDISDNNFAISSDSTGGSSITVVSPNGGESWAQGSGKSIRWTSTNIPSTENVVIQILKGTTVKASWTKPNNGIFYLTVTPSTYPVGTDYKVKITGTGSHSGISDMSNNYFKIY